MSIPENDRGNYYNDYTCTAAYVKIVFGFTARHISIVALGADGVANTGIVKVSFDGTNLHGDYRPGETEVMDGKMRDGIYVKDSVITDKVRIKAW